MKIIYGNLSIARQCQVSNVDMFPAVLSVIITVTFTY